MILTRDSFEWANDATDLQSRGWVMFPLNGDDGYFASFGTRPGDFGMHPELFPTISTLHPRAGSSREMSLFAFDGLNAGCGRMLPYDSKHLFVSFNVYLEAGANFRMELLNSYVALPLRAARATLNLGALDGTLDFHTLWLDGIVTAPGLVRTNIWNNIQVEYDRRGPLTHFRVKLNGVLVIDLAGVSSSPVYDLVSIVGFWGVATYFFGGGAWPSVFIDDVVVSDDTTASNNGFLGEVGVTYLAPTADAHYQQFDPAGLSHYNLVNEHPTDHGTSYISASGLGSKLDSYTLAPITTAATVLDISTVVVAEKTDSGSRLEDGLVRIAGADYLAGTPAPIVASYAVTEHSYALNPSTAAAWTPAQVNAAEFGTKIT